MLCPAGSAPAHRLAHRPHSFPGFRAPPCRLLGLRWPLASAARPPEHLRFPRWFVPDSRDYSLLWGFAPRASHSALQGLGNPGHGQPPDCPSPHPHPHAVSQRTRSLEEERPRGTWFPGGGRHARPFPAAGRPQRAGRGAVLVPAMRMVISISCLRLGRQRPPSPAASGRRSSSLVSGGQAAQFLPPPAALSPRAVTATAWTRSAARREGDWVLVAQPELGVGQEGAGLPAGLR